MTLRAMLAGDQNRLAALASVGDELVRRARKQIRGSEDGRDELVTVEAWAALFRSENYRPQRADDGTVIVQYEHPEAIASELAPSLVSLDRGNEALRLQITYARTEDRVAPVETLLEDLRLARDLAANPPVHGPLHPADPVAAVAAAAIVACAQRRASVPVDDLRWAAEVLLESAMRPQLDEMSFEGTMYPMGADRSAAAALPALLLPAFDALGLERRAIGEALRRCASSLFDEVRAAFATGIVPIWAAGCDPGEESGICRHEAAWSAIQAGVRDCRLGDWDQAAQRRLTDPLPGPYDETLATVETERLLVNRLTAPLVATAHAARSGSCVAGSARRLLEVLLDAHRRGWDHWARKGYGDHNDRRRPSAIRVLVEAAVAGDARPSLTMSGRSQATRGRWTSSFTIWPCSSPTTRPCARRCPPSGGKS